MTSTETAEQKGWSVLVHLVGHHDLYLQATREGGSTLLLAHEGHSTYSAGSALLKGFGDDASVTLAGHDAFSFTTGLRFGWTPSEVESRLARRGQAIPMEELAGRDKTSASPGGVEIVGVRAPILLPVLAAHRARSTEKQRKLALLLLSTGPTAPKHAQRGHSTELVTAALKVCLERSGVAAGVELQHHHFDTGSPHAFSDLPEFIRSLNRTLGGYRRAVVAQHGDSWAEHFDVTLSVNTGTTAVIAGLVRGTEEFKPSMMHVSEARRWPEDSRGLPRSFKAEDLGRDDVRQAPAVPLSEFREDPVVQLACEAMRDWRTRYREARPDAPTEANRRNEDQFWFRKGTQEVLAVIVVRDQNDPSGMRVFAGVNLEVSLPTGTLCAERNTIGTAFASMPRLERKDFLAVAVLGLGSRARLGPCGACQEWLRKMAEANPDLRVITFEGADCEKIFVDAVG